MNANHQGINPKQSKQNSNFRIDQNQQTMNPNYQGIDPNQQTMNPNYQGINPNQQTLNPGLQNLYQNQQVIYPIQQISCTNQQGVDINQIALLNQQVARLNIQVSNLLSHVKNLSQQIMILSQQICNTNQIILTGTTKPSNKPNVSPPKSNNSQSIFKNISHYYILTKQADFKQSKLPCLLRIIQNIQYRKIIIFVTQSKDAETIKDSFMSININSSFISNSLPQNIFQKNLRNFLSGKSNILISTDPLPDAPFKQISAVIFCGLPKTVSQYQNKISIIEWDINGGFVLSIIAPDHQQRLNKIEKQCSIKIFQFPFLK